MAYYVLDEKGNKIEAYSKQETLALLEQAIEDGTLENITKDSGFIDKIRCCVGLDTHKIAFVTQAKYNALESANQLIPNAYYYITDDNTCDNLNNSLVALTNTVNALDTEIGNVDGEVALIDGRVTALENKPLIPFVINGTNGATIELEKGKTYAFNLSISNSYNYNFTLTIDYTYEADSRASKYYISNLVYDESGVATDKKYMLYLRYVKYKSDKNSVITLCRIDLSAPTSGWQALGGTFNGTYREV